MYKRVFILDIPKESNKERINSIYVTLMKYVENVEFSGKSIKSDLKGRYDLIFLHLNDLVKIDGGYVIPDPEILVNYHKSYPNTVIIFYSGGGINIVNKTDDTLEIEQSKKKWSFKKVNSNKFVIIEREVNSSDDINLYDAFKKYIETKNESVFRNEIIGFDPSLEAQLYVLYSLVYPPQSEQSVTMLWNSVKKKLSVIKKINDCYYEYIDKLPWDCNLNDIDSKYKDTFKILRDGLIE